MLVAVLSGFIFSALAFWLHKFLSAHRGDRGGRAYTEWLLSLVPVSLFIYFSTFIIPVSKETTIKFFYQWVPGLDVTLNFFIDGLSLTFALLITGIGALIFIYSEGYFGNSPKLGIFYSYLMLFMASMLGLVLADNIITLFIFWELTSVSSFFLIGFNNENERSRYSALQALLVTGLGGLALLAGLIILGLICNTGSISEIVLQNSLVTSSPYYMPVLVLLLAGAFSKSAQVPLHFWLPNAMAAPTPVSAYLHSATMVKAGVYLVARFNPVMVGPEMWTDTLIFFGSLTMLVGAVMSIFQYDLKKILAYTTISALGILIFMIGIGTEAAIKAAVVFLIVHSLYKGSLFLVAGAIDVKTGTRDIRRLSGLFRAMPVIAVASIFAAMSYAGLPPFFGFIGKELIYESLYEITLNKDLLLGLTIFSNMILVATAFITGIRPFSGGRKELKVKGKTAPELWIGPLLLGAGGLFIGIFPMIITSGFISTSMKSITGIDADPQIYLWHGFNIILILSIITLGGGIIIYYLSRFRKEIHDKLKFIIFITPSIIYDFLLNALNFVSAYQTRIIQNGYLRYYIFSVIIILIGSITVTVYNFIPLNITFDFDRLLGSPGGINVNELIISFLIIAASVLAVMARSRMAAVVALGVVGYGIAVIFIFFGAPDLAMTQFSIETLTVIIFILVIYRLPRFYTTSPMITRIRDIIISISAGIVVMMLVLMITEFPANKTVSNFFATNSYLLAKGRNVVNVILVDFRALDTLGEIIVLSVSAIGIYALMKLRLGRADDSVNKGGKK